MRWFYIIFTGAMFGSLGLGTEYLTSRGISPFLCAAIPFTITAAIAVAGRWKRLAATPWKEGLALGAVNAGAPALLFNIGFNELPASIVTIILALGPVFTTLAAHFFTHDDRFTFIKTLGLIVSFTGVAILAGSPNPEGTPLTVVAVTLAGAAVSGGSLVWVKRAAHHHSPRAVLPAMMTGAGAISMAITVALGDSPTHLQATGGQWLVLIAMGVGGLAAFLGSLRANELNPASRAGLMGYLVPLVGVLGGVLLFHEAVTANLIFGGLVVIVGVTLVGRANPAVTPLPTG